MCRIWEIDDLTGVQKDEWRIAYLLKSKPGKVLRDESEERERKWGRKRGRRRKNETKTITKVPKFQIPKFQILILVNSFHYNFSQKILF